MFLRDIQAKSGMVGNYDISCAPHMQHVLVPKLHPNQYISCAPYMPACPGPKTPPKPVHILCSIHACMSWSQNSTQTSTYPVLHTCSMSWSQNSTQTSTYPVLHTCLHVLVPKLHPNQYISCAPYMPACPGRKTPPKPVHFLWLIHATCI